VVEDRYSRIFTSRHVAGRVIADGLAELQVRWPTVPIVFMDTRKLAEEWTYRYLAAAHAWASDESAAVARIGTGDQGTVDAPAAPLPAARELRAWARANGIDVPDRGRLRPEIHQAWADAHKPPT
jgi:hypothetical protein